MVNSCILLYTQTYTMIGTPSDPGIMVRVMNDLFIHSESQGKRVLSYVVLCCDLFCYIVVYYVVLQKIFFHFPKINIISQFVQAEKKEYTTRCQFLSWKYTMRT